MTKREICERLLEIRDQLKTGWQRNDVPARELCRDATFDLRDLILDLAAPKEEPKEAHHGIIVDPKGEHPPRCLRCGLDAEIVSYIGRGEEWVLCPKCGCAYRIGKGRDKK